MVDKSLRPVFVLLFAFVLLGMPNAALSVVWPSMADELGRNLGDLGILMATSGVTYGIVSLSSGSLTKRVRAGLLLALAVSAGTFALAVIAFTDSWVLLVLVAIPLGFSGGAIDSIGNGYVAVYRGPRAMGLIHAAFGLGSMIAPIMVTVLVAAGLSWRVGFVILAVAEGLLATAFFVTRSQIRMPMEGRSDRAVREGRKRLLAASVWLFFVYAAIEGSIGTWLFTLMSEGQGISETVAGAAVALHWAGLFASRLGVGIAGGRVRIDRTVTLSVIGLAVGVVMVWWNPSTVVVVVGAVVAGVASGPVFPLQMNLNKPRFGSDFTPWAVGYQLTAVTVAVAFIPIVIGAAVNRWGADAIGPALIVLAVAVVVSNEVLRVLSTSEPRRTTKVSAP